MEFYVLFTSISVISGQWEGDNERLWAVEPCLGLKRFPPPWSRNGDWSPLIRIVESDRHINGLTVLNTHLEYFQLWRMKMLIFAYHIIFVTFNYGIPPFRVTVYYTHKTNALAMTMRFKNFFLSFPA